MIAKIHGMRAYTDAADDLSLKKNGLYEPLTTKWIRENARKDWNIVDAGAHIGYYTLLFSKVGNKVYAFEPDQENFRILNMNLALNKISNVQASMYALGDKQELRGLYKNHLSGDNRLFDPGPEYRVPQRSSGLVHVMPLDSFPEIVGSPVHLVKIDVQGWESRVIEGMQEIMRRNPQLRIICEWSPRDMTAAGCDPYLFLHWMGKLGFVVWEFNKWKKKLEPLDLDSLNDRVTEENYEHADLLFLRGA